MALATTYGNKNKINITGYDFSSKYWKQFKTLILPEHKVFLILLGFCGVFCLVKFSVGGLRGVF